MGTKHPITGKELSVGFELAEQVLSGKQQVLGPQERKQLERLLSVCVLDAETNDKLRTCLATPNKESDKARV